MSSVPLSTLFCDSERPSSPGWFTAVICIWHARQRNVCCAPQAADSGRRSPAASHAAASLAAWLIPLRPCPGPGCLSLYCCGSSHRALSPLLGLTRPPCAPLPPRSVQYRPSSAFNSPHWTTNSGAPVWNNNNSLTVGERGERRGGGGQKPRGRRPCGSRVRALWPVLSCPEPRSGPRPAAASPPQPRLAGDLPACQGPGPPASCHLASCGAAPACRPARCRLPGRP